MPRSGDGRPGGLSDGLVAGRFRLGELLGSGGSASVFAALDTRTGDEIALKVLHPHLAGRDLARAAFVDEARRASSVRHPNVAAVLDAGLDGDAGSGDREPLAWIALERAHGESLGELVGRRGGLPLADALAIADAVLAALASVHAAGLVHRDVSPSNVLVVSGSDGSVDPAGVRLIDFGVADLEGAAALASDELLAAHATGRTGVLGNADYVSPEQASGAPVDARGDIYQAGALLYFALVGEPPFRRPTADQTLRAHLEQPPPVASVLRRDLPRAVDRLIVRALLKAPAERFASADDMRAALAAARPSPAIAPAPTRSVPAVRGAAARRTTQVTRVLGGATVPPPGHPPRGADVAPGPGSRRSPGAWIAGTVLALMVATVAIVAYAAPGPGTAAPRPSVPASAPPSEAPPPPSAPATVVTTVPLPPLVGLTLDEARIAVETAGLVVGEVTTEDSPQRSGTVLSSAPEVGVRVAHGERVSLAVASGYNEVPAVRGLTRDQAFAALVEAGFAPTVSLREVPGLAAGDVLGSEPGAGSAVWVGSIVAVTITSASSVTPAPTPEPTGTPTPGGTPTPLP